MITNEKLNALAHALRALRSDVYKAGEGVIASPDGETARLWYMRDAVYYLDEIAQSLESAALRPSVAGVDL